MPVNSYKGSFFTNNNAEKVRPAYLQTSNETVGPFLQGVWGVPLSGMATGVRGG